MEALLGAIYLDGGLDPCREVAERLMFTDFPLDPTVEIEVPQDAKGALQAYAQLHRLPIPKYNVIREQGPVHARVFTVEARLGKEWVAQAEGTSKKAASLLAAAVLLERIRVSEPLPPQNRRTRLLRRFLRLSLLIKNHNVDSPVAAASFRRIVARDWSGVCESRDGHPASPDTEPPERSSSSMAMPPGGGEFPIAAKPRGLNRNRVRVTFQAKRVLMLPDLSRNDLQCGEGGELRRSSPGGKKDASRKLITRPRRSMRTSSRPASISLRRVSFNCLREGSSWTVSSPSGAGSGRDGCVACTDTG